MTPDYAPGLKARILRGFAEDAIGPAMRLNTGLLREAMRGFHMLEHPNAWLRRPGNFARILWYWARGKKRNLAAYPPKAGPERDVMMRALDLPADADIAILAERRRAMAGA